MEMGLWSVESKISKLFAWPKDGTGFGVKPHNILPWQCEETHTMSDRKV